MSKIKKLLSWVLVVVLTAGLSIAGTMAYFTDEDSAVNVMTVGNVQITQNEQERIDHTNVEVGLQEFTQNQSIVPAADVTGVKTPITVNGYQLNIRTGETYVDKIVSVTNDGVNDAYVRTIFAFPEAGEFDTTTDASEQWLHWNGVSNADTTPANGWMWGTTSEWPANADGWDVVENVKIMGKTYDIYVATNTNVISAGEKTSPSLMGFYLDTRVDYDGTNYTFTDKTGKEWNLGDISNLDILVLSQAVQTEGFADARAALDIAFGDVTAESAAEWFGNMKIPVVIDEEDEVQGLVDALNAGRDIYGGEKMEILYESEEDIIVDAQGATATLNGGANGISGEYGYLAFIPTPGKNVTLSNLNVTGSGFVEVGHYGMGGGNYILNNVVIKDLVSTLRNQDGSNYIGCAFMPFGTATLNDCVMTGTTAAQANTTPVDLGVGQNITTTINRGEYAHIYVWGKGHLTINGAEVEKITSRANSYQGGSLTINKGTHVGTLELISTKEPNLIIEDGAIIDTITWQGKTYTQKEWIER